MRLPFHPEAFEELETSVAWYERERPGYGDVFHTNVQRRVAQAADFPRSGWVANDMPAKNDVRVIGMRLFPYLVVTALIHGERHVVALVHTSREPGYWHDRVR